MIPGSLLSLGDFSLTFDIGLKVRTPLLILNFILLAIAFGHTTRVPRSFACFLSAHGKSSLERVKGSAKKFGIRCCSDPMDGK